MSSNTYAEARERTKATCGFCGRTLGTEYHFVCHVCGAAYCYAHIPGKCNHQRFQPARVLPA